jgi:hypothetical protein
LRRGGGGPLHGGEVTVHRNYVGVDVADVAVFGLNTGKDKAVNKDREALAARHRADYFRRLSGFGENLDFIGMAGTIHEANIVSPSG